MKFRVFYLMTPKIYRNWLQKHVDYCNFSMDAVNLLNSFLIFSLIVGALSGFAANLFLGLSMELSLIAFAGGFLIAEVIMHMAVVMIADSRANFVELILPDALQIISSNLRSGLTPDKAILTSARPEFGPLEAELKKVSKETLAGMPFEESLKGITKRIKSPILEKTVGLLVEGLSKGGSLTTLLDGIANDVRQSKLLRGEIKSYVMMYGIFIFFAAGIGAPMLYSVSSYMVEVLTGLTSQVATSDLPTLTTVPFFSFEPSAITADFMILYSSVALLVTSIFGALLIGLVQDGKEKAGIKFIPILLGASFGVFFGGQFILREFIAVI